MADGQSSEDLVDHKFQRSASLRDYSSRPYIRIPIDRGIESRAREAIDDLKNGRPSTSVTPFAEGDDGNGKVGDRVGTLTLGNRNATIRSKLFHLSKKEPGSDAIAQGPPVNIFALKKERREGEGEREKEKRKHAVINTPIIGRRSFCFRERERERDKNMHDDMSLFERYITQGKRL